MKVTGDPLQYSRALPKQLRAVLFYGPNQPVKTEAIAIIRKNFLGADEDDFAVVTMTPERLKNDPTAIADEMSSFGFFAAKKLIHVKGADDSVVRAIQAALDSPDAGHFLIVEADELTPKSALRAWGEKAENAAAIPCYMLEGAALVKFIQNQFQQQNIRVTNDACALLVERMGGDVSGLKNQIEQLRLYAGRDTDIITDQHVGELFVDQAEQEMDNVVQAVANQDAATLDRVLPVLYESGTAMVAVLRSLQYYFYRLRTVQAAIESGTSPDTALMQLRPPVFFKAKPAFTRHLRMWPMARIDMALQEFMALEAACKKTGTPELILVQHRLTRLCLLKKAA